MQIDGAASTFNNVSKHPPLCAKLNYGSKIGAIKLGNYFEIFPEADGQSDLKISTYSKYF